jgi:hypothetical protein
MKSLFAFVAPIALLLSGCPLPELGGKGQECFDNPQDPCNPGLACRPFDDICIEPECTLHTDCSPDEHCDFNLLECKPGTATGCEGDWDCPSGFHCQMDINECRPDEGGCENDGDCPLGFYCELSVNECWEEGGGPDGSVGHPCPLNGVHMDAPACKSHLECIWISWGQCYSGNPDECWLVPPTLNTVCMENSCQGSWCAEECSGDSCSYGFVPIWVDDTHCYCAPVPPSNNCDPMNNQECGAERCLPLPYDSNYTYCVPVGGVPPGGTCDYNTGDFCGRGHICMGICTQICDLGYPDCSAGECLPMAGDAWGFCSAMP